MKRLAISGILATATTLFLSPLAQASGWIVIDPIVGGGVMPHPTPIHIVRPGPHMPDPHHPVLHGGVSFGLHLQSESVSVDISDQVAKTYITQTFSNDTDSNLAGTYLFPLPDDTTFSSFSLQIDGKPVEGKILEAAEARQQYETIVRQMVDPGLLEYADYKTVRARIFPIPAHGTKKVELEYTQLLKAENGLLKYRFPLKAEENAEPSKEVKVNVKLASKQGLRTIWSPSHTITTDRENDNKAKIAYVAHDTLPDKDFYLYYSVSDKDMAANLLDHKKTDEDGYFLLTLSPPMQTKEVVGKDIVLVADTSGSMQGEKMEQNKQALKYVVNALSPQDHFSIVQFNTDVDSFKTELLAATPENKKAAVAYIDDMEARGGTNISDALHTATTMLNAVSPRPAYLVMLTDGEPTVGETDVSRLLSGVTPTRDVRIFDFGVGNDVNTRLLNKLAEDHHGTSQYVDPSENIETALSSFYQKIKSPVLSDVKITYDGIQVKDVYPREVKDIFAGTQAILLGRYKGAGKASIKLTGTVNGAPKEYNFPVSFASEETDHTYLPRLWAMRRIGHLSEVAQANSDNREIVDEIVALSRKYGIISAYTSFLVTDPSENHRLGTPVARPMPMSLSNAGGVARQSRPHGGGGFIPPPPAAAPVAMGAAVDDSLSLEWGGPVRGTFASAGGGGAKGGARFEYAPTTFRLDAAPQTKTIAGRLLSARFKEAERAPSGEAAVKDARAINELKNKVAVEEGQSAAARSVKTVEDKTFYLTDGVWTDSSIDQDKPPKSETITFGSKEYFDLIHSAPGISKYLSVGKQVLVEFKGKCYKIVPPASDVG